MIRIVQRRALTALVLLLGCADAAAHDQPQRDAGKLADAALPATPAKPSSATAIAHELRPIALSSGPGVLHRFRIPLAEARFSFVDLAYRTPLIEALGTSTLLFNGGYWAYRKRDRVIEGLVVVNDMQHSPKNANSSGGVLEVRNGQARMHKSGDYQVQPSSTLAVQCSPRLVVDGAPIPKLDTVRLAARTALCVGADRSQLDVYLTDDRTRTTLSELGAFLVGEGCVEALNLDGGPSTAAVAQGPEGKIRVGFGDALPYGFGVTMPGGLTTKQASRTP